MRHLITRGATLLTLTVALLAIAVPIASAHMTVASRTPAVGSKVKKTLKAVSITFGSQAKKGTLVVKTAGGTKVSVGTGGVDPRNVKRVTVSLKSGLAAGKYVATWTATAPDGHKLSGSWSFTLIN